MIPEISSTFRCVPNESSSDINQNGILDECECLADLTDDGDVNASDLAILLGSWGGMFELIAEKNQVGCRLGESMSLQPASPTRLRISSNLSSGSAYDHALRHWKFGAILAIRGFIPYD